MESNFKYRVEVPAWRTVEVSDSPVGSVRELLDLHDLEEWCRRNVGLVVKDWLLLYYSAASSDHVFCFRDEASATLFRLVIPR